MQRIPALFRFILFVIVGMTVMAGVRISASLYLLSQQASPLTVGILIATFALVAMFCAVPVGRWVDRVGARKPLLAGALAILAGALLAWWNGHALALYGAGALVGTGYMLVHVVAQHGVGQLSNAQNRTANFAWLTLGMSFAAVCSPVLGGVMIDSFGYASAFRVFAMVALLLLLLVEFLHVDLSHLAAPAHSAAAAPQGKLLDLAWRLPRLRMIYLIGILLASSWDLFMFVTPVQGSARGFSAATIGMILASFSLATFVIRFLMQYLTPHLLPWTIISITLALACIGFLLFPWQQQAWSMMLLAFFLGLGLGGSQPNMLTLLFHAAPPGRGGEALGIRISITTATQVFIPMLFGALGGSLGLWPVCLAMSVLLALGWLMVWRTPHD
jgi:MFS family permease